MAITWNAFEKTTQPTISKALFVKSSSGMFSATSMLDWIVRRVPYYSTEISVTLRHLCCMAQSMGALFKPKMTAKRVRPRVSREAMSDSTVSTNVCIIGAMAEQVTELVQMSILHPSRLLHIEFWKTRGVSIPSVDAGRLSGRTSLCV